MSHLDFVVFLYSDFSCLDICQGSHTLKYFHGRDHIRSLVFRLPIINVA